MAVVDDSVVVRGLFARWLAEMPDVELVGVHRDGLEALRQAPLCQPDVIVLDIEMPDMDGLTALPLLLEAVPKARVLVVSALSIRGADLTLKCLMRGASEYLSKPTTMAKVSTTPAFKEALQQRVRALGTQTPQVMPARGIRPLPERQDAALPSLLLIGASTGGPAAVVALLAQIPAVLQRVPVVVCQHMPSTFTALFADHLRRHCRLDAREITGGEMLGCGVIHVVRGDCNLVLIRDGAGIRTRAVDHPGTEPRPSIDLMLASAADLAGPSALAVIMTGSGQDGAAGAARLAAARGTVLAQDPATCAVGSMPKAIVDAGDAVLVGDIPVLAGAINRLCLPG